MALDDIYYKQPWNPRQSAADDIQRGLQGLADMPMKDAQLEAQKQSNKDAAYNSNARPATGVESAVGDHIIALMRNTPGHTPEHEAALTKELSQLQSSAGQGPVQGTGEAPVQNLGPSGYGQPAVGAGGYAGPQTQRPFGPPQAQMPGVTSSGGLGGPSAPPPTMGTQQGGIQTPPMPQLPTIASTPASGGSVAANAPPMQPYSRGDVHTLMQAAPLFKDKDEEKRREFDAMMDYRNRALAAKEKLGRLAADVKQAANDNDRKRALELLKIETMREIAGIQAQARMGSSIYGVINQDATASLLQYISSFSDDAEKSVQQVSQSPGVQAVEQPVHHVTPNTAPRALTPRPNGTGTQYTKGQLYPIPGAPWGPKSKYAGKDAQGQDHWVAP